MDNVLMQKMIYSGKAQINTLELFVDVLSCSKTI